MRFREVRGKFAAQFEERSLVGRAKKTQVLRLVRRGGLAPDKRRVLIGSRV